MANCKLGEKGCWKDGKCHYSHDCENKVLTHADRIRAMSDEEFSCFLTLVENGKTGKTTFDDTSDYWLKWLKQPVGDDDG